MDRVFWLSSACQLNRRTQGWRGLRASECRQPGPSFRYQCAGSGPVCSSGFKSNRYNGHWTLRLRGNKSSLRSARPRSSRILALLHKRLEMEVPQGAHPANRQIKWRFAMRAQRQAAGLQHCQIPHCSKSLEGRPEGTDSWAYLQPEGRTSQGSRNNTQQTRTSTWRVQDHVIGWTYHFEEP